MSTLYLCGAGNSEGVRLALTINRSQHRWDNIYLLDDDPAKHRRSLLDVQIVGAIDRLADLAAGSGRCEIANLVSRTTRKRAAVQQRLKAFGIPFAPLLSPDIDTLGVTLGSDIVAYQRAVLGPEVSIDAGSVVFMGGIVGHECTVGKNCVIAANAVLNARVRLHDEVYVGTNATVLPEVSIGKGATIAAGSVVIEDVPPGATAIGVPAQIMSPLARSTAEVTIPAQTLPAPTGQTELERHIAKIWKDALRIDDIDVEQRFFDLGGDSLIALKVCGRIKSDTGIELCIVDMYQYPTVRRLSQALSLRLVSAPSSSPANTQSQNRAAIRRAMHERNGLR